MEKMQWFKFSISEWKMGKIQKCTPEAKASFMELCCLYWINETNLSVEDAIIECDEYNYNNLLSKKVIKEVNGFVKIYFLDEQFESILEKSEKARISVKNRWDKRNAIVTQTNYDGDTTVLETNYEKDTTVLHIEYDSNTEEKRREEKIKEYTDAKASNIVSYKNESINLDQLLIYLNGKLGKGYKAITKEVKAKYTKLLKEGYNRFEVKSAIDNVFKDKLHIENKYKYATLEYFSRPKTIDMFATMKAEVTADNVEFTLEEKAILCRRYGIRFEYGDTNFIVPPQMTDEEKVAYRKLFDHYKDDVGPLHYELNWNVGAVGIVEYVKNRNF